MGFKVFKRVPLLFCLGVLAACGKSREPSGEVAAREMEAALERIASVGYLGSAPASGTESGVLHHDPDYAQPGLNLYVSDHAREVILIDMEGKILHRWSKPNFREIFPEYDGPAFSHERRGWRRARLLPRGELLVIQEGIGLIKLDRQSALLWAVENGAHHDLDIDLKGNLYVLTREATQSQSFPEMGVALVDAVDFLSPDGKRMDRIPLEEAFSNSEFDIRLPGDHPGKDLFHCNTLTILDGRLAGRDPAFRSGNLLLCLRNTHEIAVLDPAARKIVWRRRGPWRRQHEPTILRNGHMVLFDNKGGDEDEGQARILEFDPFTLEIFRTYNGGRDHRLRSKISGTVYELENGNFLITDSDQARAYEVTQDDRVVWQFASPHPHPKEAERRALVHDVVRIDADAVRGWLIEAPTDRAS